MVHAAVAPRCPSGPRPVYQALRAHHGPRHSVEPSATPCAAAAREGRGGSHDGEGAEEPAVATECGPEGRVNLPWHSTAPPRVFVGVGLLTEAGSYRADV